MNTVVPIQSSFHRITVCTSCRHKGSGDHPGPRLIEHLRDAISTDRELTRFRLDVVGIACMAGCSRPCTVAFHGSQKATYLFGDISPDDDIADLIEFARHYAALHDGWCSSVDRPGKMRTCTLARVPPALPVMETATEVMR